MKDNIRSFSLWGLLASIPLAVAVLAASLVALAPVASAEFEYKPGVYAKAHPPVNQELPAICLPFLCSFFVGVGGQEADWVQEILDAPEPTQAGGRNEFTTHFRFDRGGGERVQDVVTDAPAGAVGNPRAVPRCQSSDFHLTLFGACPKEAQVGMAISAAEDLTILSPLSSLVPYPGVPAVLGFRAVAYTTVLVPDIRSEGDYGLKIAVEDLPQPLFSIEGATITLWGVPHDPVHNPHRVNDLGAVGGEGSGVEGTPKPFLSAPTNCDSGPIDFGIRSRSWQQPQRWIETVRTAPEPTGCELLEFEPELEARPSTNVADSPSGLEVDLNVPQSEGCERIPVLKALDAGLEAIEAERQAKEEELEEEGLTPEEEELLEEELEEIEEALEAKEAELKAKEEELIENAESLYECDLATSHLKDTEVTLPEGLVLNPSGANGLDGCSTSEVGLTSEIGETPQQFTAEPANCPDASKIADVEVDTPLLDQPLKGQVSIADPFDNPFDSLLAIYITIDDKKTGIVAKLAGQVEPDPDTGQLTATFTDAPQLPFENFRISFKQGPHAPLRTPAVCGSYETEAGFVPYAAPGTTKSASDEWSITKGPSGGCANQAAAQAHAPAFDAGTISPIAGAESPFVLHLEREDGSQNFGAVTLNPPPGLLAKLAGTAICPDASLAAAAAKDGADEEDSPSCPANSRLGVAIAGAGAGPSPYYAEGGVYLAGPYKGAPLSLVTIAPATAGPFDLGTVVNRIAAHIDPRTAEITAVSDPLPTILEGIPLDIRTLDVALDRPSFTRNPTSCDPLAVKGVLTSTIGALANLENRFQVGECGQLGFRPKVFLRLFGKRFTRGANPRLRAVIVPREGDANISRIAVKMPRSLFLDQSHIRTVCTRVQFAADACPPGSVYGKVVAQSPLVDYPLIGNAYLRSSNNKLPDLVADLRGPAHQPVRIEGVGRTDSVKGALRNTFDIVPDAPVTKIVLLLQPGKKSLLVASRNLCQGPQRAKVNLLAHNGRQQLIRPRIKIPCRKQGKSKRNRRSAVARGSAAG